METKRRSFAKALSWRFFSTFINGGTVWFLTGRYDFAIMVGMIDLVSKIVIFFFHERLWLKIPYGRVKCPDFQI
ncbi:MAG: DUF2061 domain-containing protein [Candidatus Omnitrophica bacterium]|nr:DUF2061 domain-containing protein [Candidatus Omnitrophota bacterium]